MYRPVKAGEVFTTFIFDGKDCADMGVYSTTSSGTYTTYIEPTFKDETLEVPAYDGRYYYGTQYSTQQFQFNMFADNLSLAEYRNLKTWLKPRNVGKLILSDQPYKYYIVKVTSIGTLGEIPLTDVQHIDHNSVRGDTRVGNVVYTGRFTVTFQTIGSVYGYGLSYYRDDLIYDAKDHYAPGIYPENYYYDSGLLYKDMSPSLDKTVPSNAKDFDLTVYNPGSATAIPVIQLSSTGSYGILQITNNTLNTHTVIDLTGLSGDITINNEEEVIVDANGVKYFGRFSGNQFEVGEESGVIYIPESFVETIEDFYFAEHMSIWIVKDYTGATWAYIDPKMLLVSDELLGQYFCINGNGGARIEEVDESENRLKLSNSVVTYEIQKGTIQQDGSVINGMEFNYVGDFKTVEELPVGQLGDVASVTIWKTDEKGAEVVDRYDMYLYKYDKWSITNLFTQPSEFEDNYGEAQPQYLIFGANIVKLNDIKVNTNFGECEMSLSLLPRYL